MTMRTGFAGNACASAASGDSATAVAARARANGSRGNSGIVDPPGALDFVTEPYCRCRARERRFECRIRWSAGGFEQPPAQSKKTAVKYECDGLTGVAR